MAIEVETLNYPNAIYKKGRGGAVSSVAVEPLQLITRRRFILVRAIEQVAVPRVPGLPQEVFLVALFPKAGLP